MGNSKLLQQFIELLCFELFSQVSQNFVAHSPLEENIVHNGLRHSGRLLVAYGNAHTEFAEATDSCHYCNDLLTNCLHRELLTYLWLGRHQ